MRLFSSITLAALTLTGCAVDDDVLSAEDELTLSAISGAEEVMSRTGADSDASTYSNTWSEEGEADRPPLFRACDADGTFQGIKEGYDADASGALEEGEVMDVMDARSGREAHEEMRRMVVWALLSRVYDANDDLRLDADERATLFSDFTERCENLHARLLEDFDSDGDGALSEAELEDMADAMEEKHAECQAERAAGGEAGERPAGAEGERRGPGGEPGERPDPRTMVEMMLVDQFDTDADGWLGEDETEAMRSEIRARVVAGEHLAPPPPKR